MIIIFGKDVWSFRHTFRNTKDEFSGKISETYYRMNKSEIHIRKNSTWGEGEWKMLKLRVTGYV